MYVRYRDSYFIFEENTHSQQKKKSSHVKKTPKIIIFLGQPVGKSQTEEYILGQRVNHIRGYIRELDTHHHICV